MTIVNKPPISFMLALSVFSGSCNTINAENPPIKLTFLQACVGACVTWVTLHKTATLLEGWLCNRRMKRIEDIASAYAFIDESYYTDIKHNNITVSLYSPLLDDKNSRAWGTPHHPSVIQRMTPYIQISENDDDSENHHYEILKQYPIMQTYCTVLPSNTSSEKILRISPTIKNNKKDELLNELATAFNFDERQIELIKALLQTTVSYNTYFNTLLDNARLKQKSSYEELIPTIIKFIGVTASLKWINVWYRNKHHAS